jgi:hypothetical protein
MFEEWLYYSKKKGIHTLKYEIVVSMGNEPKIIHVNGAFGGSIHDLTCGRLLIFFSKHDTIGLN